MTKKIEKPDMKVAPAPQPEAAPSALAQYIALKKQQFAQEEQKIQQDETRLVARKGAQERLYITIRELETMEYGQETDPQAAPDAQSPAGAAAGAAERTKA